MNKFIIPVFKFIHEISLVSCITFYPAIALVSYSEYFEHSKGSDYLFFAISLTIISLSGIYTLFIEKRDK